ncbi:pyridoxamine 5'-phosphate oxidase family protein [Streptomonospora litoralis]|uniref:Pyridoxamine 5'-phosphate oxidase N-terminal domain-containing protein n=1 Tax=Streptomonospora litoralis TaxID=2498135 RepID=A0A4P6PZY7_9ACTN|nr:pyridoxamine 5'-phosphate oxidase family protein [Streptomonospora litoralis]QBI53360.1 hypothetical protein EKD16_07820 [Streptomonospora litoralis]
MDTTPEESAKTSDSADAAAAVSWGEFAAAQPGFAAQVRSAFGAAKHHVLATLRRDGSPRVSGTEVDLRGDELLLGSMPGARKAHDLRRDGRLALHANPGDDSMDPGDAKVAGVAVEVTDAGEARTLLADPGADPGGFHLFRVLLTEATVTSVEGDKLRVRHWHPDRGLVDEHRDG